MRWTKSFILRDLKQWCHEYYQLFIQGDGKQVKPSIGCREDVNNMFYNPLFKFGTIIENPCNTSFILKLFDDVVEKNDQVIDDSDYFPCKNEFYS